QDQRLASSRFWPAGRLGSSARAPGPNLLRPAGPFSVFGRQQPGECRQPIPRGGTGGTSAGESVLRLLSFLASGTDSVTGSSGARRWDLRRDVPGRNGLHAGGQTAPKRG